MKMYGNVRGNIRQMNNRQSEGYSDKNLIW